MVASGMMGHVVAKGNPEDRQRFVGFGVRTASLRGPPTQEVLL